MPTSPTRHQKVKAKRLRADSRTRKGMATVREARAGYTFAGTRGDGEPVTVTLCESGQWHNRIGDRSEGTASGTQWYIRSLTYKNSRNWVTQVGANRNREDGGWRVGFARQGDAFQFGIASFDSVTHLGPVTRSPDQTVCQSGS